MSSKEKKPKAERCRVCNKKVQTMCQKGTGLCSRNCEKKEQESTQCS